MLIGVLSICGLIWITWFASDRPGSSRTNEEKAVSALNVDCHNNFEQIGNAMASHPWNDLLQRLQTDPHTEAGTIATAYNQAIASLEAAVQQTRAVIRDMRDGIVTFNSDGQVTSLNPGAEKLLRVSADTAIGHPLHMILQRAGCSQPPDISELRRSGTQFELRMSHPPTRDYYEISISETRIGSDLHYTAMVRDVSDRKHIESQLHRERDLAQVTLASIGDGVITTDEVGVVQYLNPVAERLTGWNMSQAYGQSVSAIYRLRDEKTGEPINAPVRKVLRNGEVVSRPEHAMLERRDGKKVPVRDTASPIRSREGHLLGSVLVFHDVTVPLDLTRKLSHQASHDALTGIPNRGEFERRLNDLLDNGTVPDASGDQSANDPSYSKGNVVCYLDLDQFKVVNDTCGHVAGDELLRQIALLIRAQLRASDLLARLGGDEFGLILESCTIEQAKALCERICDIVSDFRFAWAGQTFAIGVSIGLVSLQNMAPDFSAVLSAADEACYAAKENGRSRVHVYQAEDDKLVEQHGQMQWVARLQAALDEERLLLYVQPIIPLSREDPTATHHEILIRLIEDDKLVEPGAFLPAAERYGLMPRIDQWVVVNTLTWVSEQLRRRGKLDGIYAINLSGASLSDERFRTTLHTLLQRVSLPAGLICFEITETAAVANLSKVVSFIREIKQLGCLFALDDFGSGFSSFTYLKNLPVDFLKIDGSFIKNIENNLIDQAMVQAINTIGQTMGLKTIAEYVATEGALKRVSELGINYAQGFQIGIPQPLGAWQSKAVYH